MDDPQRAGSIAHKHPRLISDDKAVVNESLRQADALFHTEFARRAERRFVLRAASDADREFLVGLFADVHGEAQRRLGGEAIALGGPLLDLQIDAQRRAYRAAYPQALDYIVLRQTSCASIGRMLIDWSLDHGGASIAVDVAVLPSERAGAVGWLLLCAWLATCDRLGVPAALRVMPHNPARRIYRKLGFLEQSPDAFPVPMRRAARS